jgi:hypothetical protein
VNAKATRAKVYELASTYLLKEKEKEEPELPSIFPTTQGAGAGGVGIGGLPCLGWYQ